MRAGRALVRQHTARPYSLWGRPRRLQAPFAEESTEYDLVDALEKPAKVQKLMFVEIYDRGTLGLLVGIMTFERAKGPERLEARAPTIEASQRHHYSPSSLIDLACQSLGGG
jgi:hypothetical protein